MTPGQLRPMLQSTLLIKAYGNCCLRDFLSTSIRGQEINSSLTKVNTVVQCCVEICLKYVPCVISDFGTRMYEYGAARTNQQGVATL